MADGRWGSPAEPLTKDENNLNPTGISPNGGTVILERSAPETDNDLMRLPLTGDRRLAPLVQTKFTERNGTVSPDGRWLAYQSNGSGRDEIYIRPFPNVTNGQWQVSTAGGTRPLWARNGQELFFLALDGALMRVPLQATDVTWGAGPPARLFAGQFFAPVGTTVNNGRTYDVSPDGQRFLMIKGPDRDQAAELPGLVVIEHLDEELKRIAPTK